MAGPDPTAEQQAELEKQEAAARLLAAARAVVEAKAVLATAQGELKKLTGEEPPPEEEESEDHWSNYAEYNKTVRAWFVSFGIGAPALFLINPPLLEALRKAETGSWVVILFLAGCGMQVFVALLNKIISWYMYRGEGDAAFQGGTVYRICNVLSSFVIDAVADVATFAAFGFAVYLLFQLNLSEIGPTLVPSMPK